VPLGATPAQAAGAARDGWVLVVDASRRPSAGLSLAGSNPRSNLRCWHRGGTVATVGGPLRNVLDAALSSPKSTRGHG